MKYTILLALLAMATPLFAVDLRVSISAEGKPIPKGVKIDVECGSKKFAAESDANGKFNLEVPEGKCVLKLTYEGQPLSVDIDSRASVTSYELILERKDGKLTLNVRGMGGGIP